MVSERKAGWWYPYIFVAFFLVVMGVNFTMAYFATSTFSGLATERPYEKGLAFNVSIEEARKQDDMGWTVDVQVEPAANHGAHVTVSYRDGDGHAVEGLSVTAQMIRPTAKGHDREVALARVSPGSYATHQELPLAGVWDMNVMARGKDVSYGLSRRILVP